MRILLSALTATVFALGVSADTYTDANGVAWYFTANGANATLGDGSSACIATSTAIDAGKIPWTFTKDETAYTVKFIANKAFYNCTKLTGTLTIPDTVTSAGESAFEGCKGLAKIASLGGITSLSKQLFQNATGLSGSDFPDMSKVISIGKWVFRYCNMSGEVYLDSLTGRSNADGVFIGSQVAKVHFPRSSYYLTGNQMFSDCATIKGVYIPGPDSEGVANVRLSSLFANCTALKVFLVGPRVFISSSYDWDRDKMFTNVSGCLVFVPAGAAISGKTWDDLDDSVTGQKIMHYGPDQDLDLSFDHTAKTITATVKTAEVLTNILNAAPYFKSEFGYSTKIATPKAIEIAEDALSGAVFSDVSYDTLAFAVTTQEQLDTAMNATRAISAPIGIDPAGAKSPLVVPSDREVWIRLSGTGEYRPHVNGLVISLH